MTCCATAPPTDPHPDVVLPVLAEVVRSGFVESRHTGSVVAVAPDGEVVLALGDPGATIFPRSANKPLQAVGMVRAGLDVDDPKLAIAAASHSGEPAHVELVRSLLIEAGLRDTDLGNTASLPLDQAAAAAVWRSGGGPAPIYQNCSGKHAAMLATCVAAGWPISGYLDPSHPLQAALGETVETLAGESVAAVGVDGCGAPIFAISLLGLARCFARLVRAEVGTPERRVADAMRAWPALVGGTGRDVTALMVGVPGLLAKDGAEGVYAAATADGAAVALKIADGGDRARGPVLVAGLRRLGVQAPVLDELAESPVFGGGRQVGVVRAVSLPG
jgi:L-asparaginase II